MQALAATLLFPVLTVLALGAWVYADALARDSDHPLRWAVEVVVLPPVVAAYVHYRGDRTRPQSDRERLALAALLALLAALLAGMAFSPPDVLVRPRTTFGALLVTAPLFYLLVYRGGGGTDDREEGERGNDSDENG